jgi:hypothetical protein
MKTKSANVSTVDLADGRVVCLSYGVIVAAFIPRGFEPSRETVPDAVRVWMVENPQVSGYIRTDKRYSVTTSKHMNQFAGKDAPIVPDATLQALCSPVQGRRR